MAVTREENDSHAAPAKHGKQAEREAIADLLKNYGRTYATEAGIRLADRPSPLYRLFVLAKLLSTRISAGIAVAAARELFAAGYRTPAAMARASWQDRVDALGQAHYRRYDERTSTMLGAGADQLPRDYRGDLRRLRESGWPKAHAARDCQRTPTRSPACWRAAATRPGSPPPALVRVSLARHAPDPVRTA